MFQFKLGLMWTALCIVFAIAIGASESWGAFLIIGPFLMIGVYMISSGWKQIQRDKATDRLGQFAYGIVIEISTTGASVNDRPELQAEVLFLKDGVSFRYKDVIGFDHNKYRVGDYVKLKHHEGDINILGKAFEDDIPAEVIDALNVEFDSLEGYGYDDRSQLRDMYHGMGQYSPRRRAPQNQNRNRPNPSAGKRWEITDNNYDW